MKSILKHFYVLIFAMFLGAPIYIFEDSGWLDGGFFGKHFFSTMFFLGLGVYALITTIVVVVVALVKYRRRHEFSTKSLAVTHILTVVIAVGIGYIAIPVLDSAKQELPSQIPVKPIHASRDETRKTQISGLSAPLPRSFSNPVSAPPPIPQVDANTAKTAVNNCNSALMKCQE